jgi:hypothetical protein
MRGDHEQAKQFILKYQDRLLYATDYVLEKQDEVKGAESLLRTWEQDWKFFATTDKIESRGAAFAGLGLPEGVVRKLFRDNALRWVPGMFRA